jgi:cytochrome c-type biogenesis protein CcmH
MNWWLPTTTRAGALAIVLVFAVVFVLLARSARPETSDPGALALETRLLAPCCWNGTLDTHESDLAHTLRHEIETRIAGGEATEQVQADLVTRYGPRILALPHEGALNLMLGGALVLVVGAGAFAAARVRRWRRSSDEDAAEREPTAARAADAYDARIDAELAELD